MFGSDLEDEDDSATTLSIIKELMEQLVGEMKPSGDDLAERLGRKKPGIEVMKVEAGMDPMKEKMGGMDPMDPGEEGEMMGDGMESMNPEDKLKQRLMKLRA